MDCNIKEMVLKCKDLWGNQGVVTFLLKRHWPITAGFLKEFLSPQVWCRDENRGDMKMKRWG
jgi:hypothetical protein